ncbi:MAG: hypothetical protein E6L07_15815 [Verrucomicrobia bacterium]|nr:MAG: hypothetical protein E6L07_15815 [Verrucomicrobiota bacterium]
MHQHVAGQLAFDGQVVLFRVLRAHVRGELAKIDAAEESRPIQRLDSRRRQYSGERIRKNISGLVDKGCLEERGANEVAAAKGRLCTELFENELFDGIVENAEACADAHLAGAASQPGEPAIVGARTPI